MKRIRFALVFMLAAVFAGLALQAQEPLDLTRLLKPAADSWPMYNGDYSGRRFSTLPESMRATWRD